VTPRGELYRAVARAGGHAGQHPAVARVTEREGVAVLGAGDAPGRETGRDHIGGIVDRRDFERKAPLEPVRDLDIGQRARRSAIGWRSPSSKILAIFARQH